MTAQTISDPRNARVITVTNGKGGAGKTSCTANVAGEWAANRIRVCAVDFDPQGHLGMDLGILQRGLGDDGAGLVRAILDDQPFDVLPEVRPNLDLLVGGRKLARLAPLANTPEIYERGGLHTIFTTKLAELIEKNDYELVIIDTPPGDIALQRAALGAARYVVVPVKTDPGSWDGLRGAGPIVRMAREGGNPDITYLGVVICFNQARATRVLRKTREFLEEAFPGISIFDTVIHAGESLAQDGRTRGQLARELSVDAAASKTKRIQQLRDGTYSKETSEALPENATSVAADYRRLATEIITRIRENESTPQERGEQQ